MVGHLNIDQWRSRDYMVKQFFSLLLHVDVTFLEESVVIPKTVDPFLQMFLSPMFRYLSSTTPNWSRLPKPIYRSAKGRVFNDWVSTWTSYMITKV